MRILYAEDNEVNQALVERVLRAKKCSVVFREEGEGALEALANDPEIDLILLDIELAGSMTGLDVIRAMRARNDHRPVVAITAYAMMGDRERFLEAGCDQYLPKPLVITDLLNLLDEYEAYFARADGKPFVSKLASAQTAPAAGEKPAPVAVPSAESAPATPSPADEKPSSAAPLAETPAASPVLIAPIPLPTPASDGKSDNHTPNSSDSSNSSNSSDLSSSPSPSSSPNSTKDTSV